MPNDHPSHSQEARRLLDLSAPLPLHEARRFLHEIVAAGEQNPQTLFPRKTCRELHRRTGGVPRELAALAAEALRVTRAAGEPAVSAARIREAATRLGIAGGPAGAAPRSSDPEPGPSDAGGASTRVHADDAADAGAASAPAPRAAPSGSRPKAGRPDAGPTSIPHAPHDPAGDGELKPPGDPVRVSEWVGRFISPDEPRFGDLIGTGRMTFTDEFGATEISEDPEADAVIERLKRRRGRVLPRYRRGGAHAPGWLGTTALVLVIIAALVTIAGPAQRMMARGWAIVKPSGYYAADSATATVAGEPVDDAAAPVAHEKRVAPDQARRTASAPSPTAARDAAPRLRETAASAPRAAAPAPRAAAPEPYSPPPSAQPREPGQVEPPAHQTQPDRPWAVDVGGHADAYTAGLERDRLVEATGLRGYLVPGDGVYRVVLGIYSTRERAEYGARVLRERGLSVAPHAIPLPPRNRRQ